MHSNYIYLESRFTLSSFLSARKLRYVILFNPEAIARQVPPDGLRAIVAHELAHIDYFHRRRRLGLVSLILLLRAPFAARFERRADLEAIALGYGPGLESYRIWLYRNVPASKIEEKKRDYFSPEEIEVILRAAQQNPQIMGVFSTCVPRDVAEIERRSQNPGAPCPH
jgi:integrase